MLLRLRRSMDELDRRSERGDEKLVRPRQNASEVPDAALHERHDVDHAAAGVHENADRRIDFVLLLKDLNGLLLIVFEDVEIVLGQIGYEIPVLIFDRGEDTDEVDIDFQVLGKT